MPVVHTGWVSMMDSCTGSATVVRYEVFVVGFVAFVAFVVDDEMGKSEMIGIVVVVVSGGGDMDHDMKMLGGVMMMKVL